VTGADARALRAPRWEVRWTLANDWSAPMVVARGERRVRLQTDAQSDALVVALAVPWSALAPGAGALGARLTTTAEARAVVHWGGVTDGPIEGWHRLIASAEFDRAEHPRDATRVTLQDADGGAGIAVAGPRAALGDLALRTQLLLAEGGASAADPARARWGVSARLDLKLPLGRPARLGGSGGWDAGAAVLGTAELAPWATAHALASAVAVSPLAADVPLQPRRWRFAGALSLALRAGGFALLVEDRVASAIFPGGWERVEPAAAAGLDALGWYGAFLPQNRIAVGLRRGGFTAWFSEDWTPGGAPHSGGGANWFYDSNAPDVALGVTYARAL
jgi:hypothetical protein